MERELLFKRLGRCSTRVIGSGRAWSAVGAAVLFVLSQLSAPLHYLLVMHSVCADHGALVHEVHSAHALSAQSTPASPEATLAQTGHGDQHDHCTANAACMAANSDSGRRDLELQAGVLAQGSTLAASESHRDASIYAFAPKTSPPSLT